MTMIACAFRAKRFLYNLLPVVIGEITKKQEKLSPVGLAMKK